MLLRGPCLTFEAGIRFNCYQVKPLPLKYDAFISYSHHRDSDFAPSLEKALEQFAKPTFKRRALDVFRDSNDLSASPDLWGKIEDGLSASDYFILLASPEAAQSRWCAKEVDFWKKTKSVSHFLIALTDGEIVWDEETSDFDWSRTDAIPRNLSGYFVNEPLYVDFRSYTGSGNLDLDNAEFKDRVVPLAATIHGKSVGDMVGEDLRQHRRTIRIRNGAIVALSFLLLCAGGLALYAFQQRNIAEQQTQIANAQKTIAEEEKGRAEREALRLKASNYLARAQALSFTDKTRALNVAYEGYLFADAEGLATEEISTFLMKLLHDPNPMYTSEDISFPEVGKQGFPAESRSFDGNSLRIESDRYWDSIVLSRADGNTVRVRDGNFGDAINHLGFSPSGNLVLARDGEVPQPGETQDVTYSLVAIDLEGEILARSSAYLGNGVMGGEQQAKILYDASESYVLSLSGYNPNRTARLRYLNHDADRQLSNSDQQVTDIAANRNREEVAYATSTGQVRFFSFENGRLAFEWSVAGHAGQPVTSIVFTDDGKYLRSESRDFVHVWPVHGAYRGVLSPVLEDVSVASSVQFPGDGKLRQFGDFYIDEEPFRFEYVSPSGEITGFDSIVNYTTAKDPDGRFIGQAFTLSSPDGSYTFMKNGIHNKAGELIAPMNVDFTLDAHHHYSHVAFSNDSRYMLVIDSKMSLADSQRVKVFCLDLDEIIDRVMSQPERFGVIFQSVAASANSET